jgi:hypothetical protein
LWGTRPAVRRAGRQTTWFVQLRRESNTGTFVPLHSISPCPASFDAITCATIGLTKQNFQSVGQAPFDFQFQVLPSWGASHFLPRAPTVLQRYLDFADNQAAVAVRGCVRSAFELQKQFSSGEVDPGSVLHLSEHKFALAYRAKPLNVFSASRSLGRNGGSKPCQSRNMGQTPSGLVRTGCIPPAPWSVCGEPHVRGNTAASSKTSSVADAWKRACRKAKNRPLSLLGVVWHIQSWDQYLRRSEPKR